MMAGLARLRVLGALAALLALSACIPNTVIPPLDFGFSGPGRNAHIVPARQARFAFQPLSGAPQTLLNILSSAIVADATARGIVIVQPGDPSATYLVKGYLSAVGGTLGATLIYVWDVSDPAGMRLVRVSGQQASDGGAPDPWVDIKQDTLQLVAKRTVDSLAAWLSQY